MTTPPGWTLVDDAFERTYTFTDFAGALAFVNGVGAAAEAANHHPDISFGWGTATVRWTTHSAGGVTDLDGTLAARSDEVAVALGADAPVAPAA